MISFVGMKRLGWGLAGGILVLDQVIKALILNLFSQSSQGIEVVSFFNLVLTWNRGVSFGMFGGLGGWGPWLLVGFSLVISAVLARWMMKAETRSGVISLGLIIGGALGNVVDRLRFGAVVDFLDLHVLGYHWPAFNVADSAITVGAIVLILESLFCGPEKLKTDP